VVANVETD